jgi:hypothetical protein
MIFPPGALRARQRDRRAGHAAGADPHTADLAPDIEALGFFCGIIPEKRQGDLLRFEYLNNTLLRSNPLTS